MTITCVVVCEGSTESYIPTVAKKLASRYYPEVILDFAPNGGIYFSHAHHDLATKVKTAIDLFQPELVLIHLDADSDKPKEIEGQFAGISKACKDITLPTVPVVPVQETESWMLADQEAILEIFGLESLPLQAAQAYPKAPEAVRDAKKRLHEIFHLCRIASGRKSTRSLWNEDHMQIRSIVRNLDKLQTLRSFRVFKEDLNNAINARFPWL